MRGLVVVVSGLPEGRLGLVASGGVNDYVRLWFALGVGSGSMEVYTQRLHVANFSYLFGCIMPHACFAGWCGGEIVRGWMPV